MISTTTTASSKTLVASTPQDILNDLKKRLSPESEIVLTSDPAYATKFTQRWTTFDPAEPKFSVAAKPNTIHDVQEIVRYAAANDVSFFATGGGNGYSTSLSSVQNGLNVDLSNFNSVSVDKINSTMTVGGATTFGDTYDPLYEAGKQFLSTGTSNPGVVGVSLGVGIGPLMGLHGLIVDSLISMEMVSGSGEILTVSSTENSDLFWGMRGAGFNFGIVVSATYHVYDTLNGGSVYNADISFPGEMKDVLYKTLCSYPTNMDKRLALSAKACLAFGTRLPTIQISGIFFGNKEEGDAAMKPFLDLGPTETTIKEVPHNKLVATANFGGNFFAARKGHHADLWGFNLMELDVETLTSTYDRFITFVQANPTRLMHSFWQLEKFPIEVIQSIPEDSATYPWRNTETYGFFDFHLSDKTEETKQVIDDFAKQLRIDLTTGCANPEGNILANYARGDEKPEQIYGAKNLAKLRELKAQYDPHGLFTKYNPVR